MCNKMASSSSSASSTSHETHEDLWRTRAETKLINLKDLSSMLLFPIKGTDVKEVTNLKEYRNKQIKLFVAEELEPLSDDNKVAAGLAQSYFNYWCESKTHKTLAQDGVISDEIIDKMRKDALELYPIFCKEIEDLQQFDPVWLSVVFHEKIIKYCRFALMWEKYTKIYSTGEPEDWFYLEQSDTDIYTLMSNAKEYLPDFKEACSKMQLLGLTIPQPAH